MIETGILFGNIHSFNDLNLILSSAEIPPAKPKQNFVDIPGADGSVDMTEAHGEVKYSDRTGAKFTFYMNPAGGLSESAWEAKKKEVSNLLNGLRCNIILDKDPGYYWQGRCTIDENKSSKRLRKIVVGARLAPYKLKTNVTKVATKLTATPNGIILTNARKTVCPTIISTGTAKIVVSGAEFNIGKGTHKILNFQLKQGETLVSVSGSGDLEFNYQEGDL